MKNMIGARIMFSTKRALACAVLALVFWLETGFGVDVRLIGEKVSFKASNTPLREVLEGFARAGVRVRMDPTIEATVNGAALEEPVESVLRNLLEPFGYVLIWDVLDGPLGKLPKLAEIQVFPVGQPEKATLLRAPFTNFEVTTAPDGRGPRFVANEILIGFRPGTRRDEFERLIREIGGSVVECVKGVGVYRIRLPDGANVPDLVEQLNRNPLIARAEPNYVMDIVAPIASGSRPQESLLVDTERETAGGRARAAVAVLDSGLLNIKALNGLLAHSFDALDPDRPLTDPVGHGTQMALIAGGVIAPRGTEVDGSTRGVPLVAVRAFDDNGHTSSFALMRAMEYAIEKGARVINLSWGSETSSEFLEAAIRKALQAGAVVVAAVGNEPTGKAMYPAAYDGVIGVSALGGDGKLWPQSNTGKFVMFAAPGEAEMPVGFRGGPGSYAGTSIASAYVARGIALYFDKFPNATAREAIEALKSAARDAGSAGRDAQYGYGIVDAATISRLIGTNR